jgi:hypothetical protein
MGEPSMATEWGKVRGRAIFGGSRSTLRTGRRIMHGEVSTVCHTLNVNVRNGTSRLRQEADGEERMRSFSISHSL